MLPRLSAISDGISDDFAVAAKILKEEGYVGIELQTIGRKSIGDMSTAEVAAIGRIASDHELTVVCLSHKNLFGSLSVRTASVNDPEFQRETDMLRRLADHAHILGAQLLRIMSFKKEMVLFGKDGVAGSIVAQGAWERFVSLMRAPVAVAEQAGVTLVAETCLRGMVTSAKLGAKLVNDIGSPNLKVLWDPCNALYFNERAYPDGYNALARDLIGHVHVKDAVVDIPSATIDLTEIGQGDMSEYLLSIVARLKADQYGGYISLENVYRPRGTDAQDAFRASSRALKAILCNA